MSLSSDSSDSSGASQTRDCPAVDPFPPSTYGDSFADVYDAWYDGTLDTAPTVAAVLGAVEGTVVVEHGVGTGRLALPLAESGLTVIGVDASLPMLAALEAKLATRRGSPGTVVPVLGDMAAPPLATGIADLVLIATNTLCNAGTSDRQAATIADAGRLLRRGGRLMVETYVAGPEPPSAEGALTVRSVERDRVVLTVTWRDPSDATITGQHVELSEAAGVRLRPWHVRSIAPAELDGWADSAGFVREARWENWAGDPLTVGSTNQVCAYRKP